MLGRTMKMMKRKFATFLIFLAFVFVAFGVCVGAEESIYNANIQAINEGVYTLSSAMDGYAWEDTSEGKDVAIRTNAVIVRYVNRINDLRADSRVSSEDLSREVALITLKGEVSGECAWAFESGADNLSQEARERALSVYDDTLTEIDASSSYDELSSARSDYAKAVILAIYEERIAALYSSADSVSVMNIAEAAVRDMRVLSSTELSDYDRIFEKCANEIRVQRYRECAIARFAAVYDEINGAGSFEREKEQDTNISYFLYLVSESDTVAALNSSLESSMLSVLEWYIGGSYGDYVGEVLRDIRYSLSMLKADADTAGEILDASDIFDGIFVKIIVADKKDALALYVSERLGESPSAYAVELLDEYNQAGGIFDSFTDERVLEFSLKQAKLRVDWIAECERYILRSEEFFDGGNEDISHSFEELYFAIDADMASSETLEGARDALRRGSALAEELSFEFEAMAYLFRFFDIIDAPIGDMTREDINILREAILEYDTLSASARAIIADQIAELCRKYKAALADHLYYIALGDGDMQIALEYVTLIENVAFFQNAERFVSFCEVLGKKAESEMRICELFRGIVAREGYASFTDNYKNALRECRDIYLRRIKDMPLDRTSPDAELGIIIRSAELEMLRVYAEAAISSMASSDDSEAVGRIISSALSSLRLADSAEELEGEILRAELNVYRQRAKETLSALRIRTDGTLELLEYLGAEKKGRYREELSALLDSALGALDASGEMSAAVAVFDAYEAQMLGIYKSAAAEDLSSAKAWASANIEAECAGVLAEIENMRYIGESERTRLTNAVREVGERAVQSAELCSDTRGVESLVAAYIAELGALSSEAERRELACAVEASLAVASLRADDIIDTLDGLSYIPGVLVERIKSEISQNLSELAGSFEGAENVAEVEAELSAFIAALSETERAVIAEDLESAKAELGGSLAAMRADAQTRIDGMRYLADAALEEYFSRAKQICDEALSELSGAGDISEAESIWRGANNAYGELMVSLERDELIAARAQAKDALSAAADVSKSRIDALEYLSAAEKDELSIDLESILCEFSSYLQADLMPAAVEARLAEYRQKIKALESSAEQKDVIASRAYYTAALDSLFAKYKSEDYTAKRYALISDAYERALRAITESSDAESISGAFFTAEQTMGAVVSIFEDRRAELIESVNNEYSELLKFSAQYSAENLASLAEIKRIAIDELFCAESKIGLVALSEIADSAISAMRTVRLDWISAGELSADSSGFAEYPAGYDYSVGGVWGVVGNPLGLPSDVRLSISLSDGNKFYKKSLCEAIAESRVAYVGDIPMTDAEIRERLDGLEIKGIFSIKLIRSAAVYDEFSGEYTVRILLPTSMRSERALRVVYISPDGDAEYYDAVCEDGMLVFKTTHFSDFLVLGQRRINLLPIIAILSVLGVFEGLALIATKAWMSREVTRMRAVFPIFPVALSVIIPSGGIAMLITLILIDLTLGVLIFIDLRALEKMRRNAQTARVYALPADFGDNFADGEDEISINVATEAPVAELPAYLDMVSAQDADSLISDSKASALIIRSEYAPRVCRGCKKTFINVDTLSENFARGECVSIKTLREKGLVPMSACYIKVLARGVIDKPLTVRAQSFSANAVKMITLTGGSAILEGSDVE